MMSPQPPAWMPRIAGLPTIRSRGVSPRSMPPPPKPGSDAARADLAAVQAAQRRRSMAGDVWARSLDEAGGLTAWRTLVDQHPDTPGGIRGPILTAIAAAMTASAGALTLVPKWMHQRSRPFELDPTITPPFALPRSASYPSGHAASAYAVARIVSRLAPPLAAAAYRHAEQAAAARVYAGVHFPSDVLAGAYLGTAVGDVVLWELAAGFPP